MNAMVQTLNTAGRAFVDLAVPMLLQSSLLILILLVVNSVLRMRVRAVFRYWIWMLVLLKLVLPPSLWSPVSLGTWFGDKLEVSTASLLESQAPPTECRAAGLSPVAANILLRPDPLLVEPLAPEPMIPAPAEPVGETATADGSTATARLPVTPLNWQGLVLLVWGVVVGALLLLLTQRTFFVRGLVAQADEPGRAVLSELEHCRQRLGLRQQVSLRLSPNAASPAVCGLVHPVILVPQNLASRLHGTDLQAVLFHELAHVQRGDLWANLAQTLLQIIYFYNPLFWLANALIRRIREKAVDEAVLVAMGEAAPQYPETLVHVAKLAFRRPALSLRLIGVVESRSVLTSRIKHILNRPIPKTARLGAMGLATIGLVAAVLLPMAAAQNRADPAGTSMDQSQRAQDTSRDSDGDGLSDFDEIHKYRTDPTKKDSDGDGTPDGEWNERREYAYSVRTVLRYLPPFDEKALTDDFQDGRVLKQTDEYIEVEVVHYPLATSHESIPENRNWRQDDARMREYLAPGVTTNWDEPMKRDVLAALKADGIDVETLSDKQVVEQVSRWLLQRSRSLDQVFTTWFVHFPQGKPTVYPGLEEAFRREFERDSSNYDWTLDQHFDHEVLGKGMFYHKTHGSCTSTAVYLTTVLRAVGIPTRMVLVAPAVDASDREQILMVKKAITHNRVRMTMLAGLNRARRGTTNHIFNEVYVGHRWCRLDYNQLGCSNFGLRRFGLQTHVYTFNDLSDANLAPTWGRRYAKGERNDAFRHDNPYTAIAVSELFGPHGQIPNPPCTAQELDPHPQPDVFVFYPSRGDVWTDFVRIVENTTANKTGRYQQRESYENLFDGTWLVRPQDFVILLFSLDTPERIPEGYEDLLLKPWSEIESQLQQGQTVELDGKARAMNVIVLAAPTADGLRPLVQNSRLLKAIGGANASPGVSPFQPVKLANGATVELLGICEHPSEGRPWWRPDGSLRETAPYRTAGSQMQHEEGYQDYEFALRVSGPVDTDVLWKAPGGNRGSDCGAPFGPGDQRLPDLRAYACNQRAGAGLANVFVGVAAGEWRTVTTHEAPHREGSYTLEGDQAVAFGGAYEKEGSTCVPTTTNIQRDEMNYRVVAVDDEGGLHTAESASGYGGNVLHSTTCRFSLPLQRVQALHFQTRPWTWVAYKGVSLRPGHATNVAVELQDTRTALAASTHAPGAEKVFGIGPAWEVLRDAVAERYGGTIGGFGTDQRQRAEYFETLLSRARPGDAFVLMVAFDKPVGVPPQYSDLLPLPWAEIENRVRKGQSVEAQGKARDLTVIVLAAPTSERLNTLVRRTHLLDAYSTGKGVGGGALVESGKMETTQKEDRLKGLLADASPGSTVTIPPGRYATPIEITKPVVLRGELAEDCIIEVTGDQPAVLANTQGQGQVTIENLTIRWQLAGDKKAEFPAALWVKDTDALVRNCRFASLGDSKRSPMAVYIDGRSQSTVENCRLSGFEYVVCYGPGTEGVVQDCLITDCGHQGVIGYDGSTLTVQRTIITGSKFHAVRCTGGTLHVKDNLLIQNANRAIYLGNKSGRGTITNNLIVGNGTGISGFGRADYLIANNVVVNSSFAGIDMRDSCRLSIRNNVLMKNQRGLVLFKEGAKDYNVVAANLFWSNATDVQDLEKPAGSLTADPQFADPNHGDFTARGPAQAQGHGLTNPEVLKTLWQRYEQLRSPSAGDTQPQTPPHNALQSAPAAAPAANDAVSTSLAWQRTDRYIPPDPNGFFPDDPEGGKKLDTLYQAVDKDQRSDEEILATVRRGFRRTTQRRAIILAWVGGRYFRAGGTQDPRAVEILYHAVPLLRPEAVYFGLAFVRVKTPNLLRTLADICLQGDSVGEITRGIGSQREELLSYVRPHLQDPDPARREIAEVLVKHFQGELDFEQWQRGRRLEQVQAKFTGQMPQFRETLRTGSSAARYEVLTMMWRQEIAPILDDSFLPALQTAAADPDAKVRREVARTVAGRWVLLPLRQEWARWERQGERRGADGRRVLPTQKLHPDVIPLLFKLASDSDHNVRSHAAGSGLALVLDKDEPIVRRLIELALADWQSGVRPQIVSGLRTSTDAAWQRTEQILRAAWAAAKVESEKTALLRLYKDVFECEPPAGGEGTSSRSSLEAATGAESPGPIQQKINAAAPGATIRLEPGVYQERLTIDKPLTLEGAGWDQTTVVVENRVAELVDEAKRKAPSSPEELARLQKELVEDVGRPVLAVTGARGVTIRGLKFSSPGRRVGGGSLPTAIVKLSHCDARLSDCAVVAGPGDGIHIVDQSSGAIERCLVAAVWGTGIVVGTRQDISEARIVDSDIRNCHYAGIRIVRNNKATVERCRVSGAAWHGIRYDDASPQIVGNLIFGNARSGIYASGQTAAVVQGNLFYADEMGGMSCWFQNRDLIEGNTFARHQYAGLAILGASKPSVRRNVFYQNPIGVSLADIGDNSPFAKSDGSMALENNLFWANEHDIQKGSTPGAYEPIALDGKTGVAADPQFVAPEAKDFSLKPDSPARQKGIGAADPLPFQSPWPLQPEELAIIPKGDTRDYRQWRDPVSSSRQ